MPRALRAAAKNALTGFRKARRRLHRTGWKVIPQAWRRHTEVVAEFSYYRYQRQLVDDLSDALHAADVAHVILDLRLLDRPHIVVAADDRHTVLRTLRTLPRSTWIAVVQQRTMGRFAPARRRRRVGQASAMIINHNLVSPTGIDLIDDSAGIQISFWTRLDESTPTTGGGVLAAGTLVAPAPNGVLDHIEADAWHEAQSSAHRLPAQFPHLLLVNEPVDAVYTWVDGDDPAWRARKAAADPVNDERPADAATAARFTNRDELRYSLRSLQANADWIRRIWIVTDQQVPAWLRQDERLQIVDHRDIFTNPDVLPVFNSHAIESQLHHIPGLASHYLYLNDDVFFGRPVTPELFFHGDRLMKFFLSPRLLDLGVANADDVAVAVAAKNNREFIKDHFDRIITAKLRHAPHPQLRDVMDDFEAAHPELFAKVSSSRFRSRDDYALCSSLGQYYAFATRRAVPGQLVHGYVDTDSPDLHHIVESWLAGHQVHALCINDAETVDSKAGRAAVIQDFLDSYFPLPSRWERTR